MSQVEPMTGSVLAGASSRFGGMAKKVVILGGGVGGMSAAHELIERGFDVDVYEARPQPGGKARTIYVPGSGKDGRPELPGEHGFRNRDDLDRRRPRRHRDDGAGVEIAN